jgi:hypothetical protein
MLRAWGTQTFAPGSGLGPAPSAGTVGGDAGAGAGASENDGLNRDVASGHKYAGCPAFLMSIASSIMGGAAGNVSAVRDRETGEDIFSVYAMPIAAATLGCGVRDYERGSAIPADPGVFEDVISIPDNVAGWMLILLPNDVDLPADVFANEEVERNKLRRAATAAETRRRRRRRRRWSRHGR